MKISFITVKYFHNIREKKQDILAVNICFVSNVLLEAHATFFLKFTSIFVLLSIVFVQKVKQGEVISKEDLDALLDRSELVKEFEQNRSTRQGRVMFWFSVDCRAVSFVSTD